MEIVAKMDLKKNKILPYSLFSVQFLAYFSVALQIYNSDQLHHSLKDLFLW